MNDLYTFVYRGVLTDESLDKAGRRTRASFGREDAEPIKRALSFDLLDVERLANAERMALIYTAIHAFENSVRHFVSRAMAEHHQEDWWTNVPPKVQARAKTRIEEEAKFRWHGARGGADIEYCDFGDLSSIIIVNWAVFEDILVDLEWVKGKRPTNPVLSGG